MHVVFAGGGTGGHLFPGIALAEALGLENCHFLSTPRTFDETQLAGRGISRTPVGKGEVRRALKVLKERRPDAVVGLGGGGSLPGLLAAWIRGIPFVCLEQNVLPGRLNRIAGRFARRFYSQWAETKRYLPGLNGRFLWTGSPLRRLERRDRASACRRYGLNPSLPTVLVLGGSQGADALNRRVPQAAAGLAQRVEFLHLTGREDRCAEVRQRYDEAGVVARVVGFEQEMDWAYSTAHAAVSRAGAIAIAELGRFRIPTFYIPFPGAVDDHQAINALAVARRGGGVVVRESAFDAAGFQRWLSEILKRGDDRSEGRGSMDELDCPDAVGRILADLKDHVIAT